MADRAVENLLGKILRRERQKAGLSQESLGHQAGVDRTYISMLENGKASPTLEMLFRLCETIGVSAASVVSEVERHR